MKHIARKSVFSIIAIALLLLASVIASAQDDTDFQVWNETTLVFPVVKEKDKNGKESDKLSLLVLGVLRLGQNRLFPVDARIGTGFDLKLNKYWSFAPTYVYRRGEPVRNAKEFEHRLRFDLTVGNKWKHFSIKDRSRVEYRIRNNRDDSVRYRNKITFAFPVRYKKKEIFSPFIADDIYYDITAKEFSTNDFFAGVSRKLSKNISADVFYIRRDYKTGAIRHINGLGSTIKIRID